MNKPEKIECLKLGQFLKEKRLESAHTQKDVADHCGHANSQFISNIERGQCWPPMNVLVQMSDLYKVSRSELLIRFTESRKKVWAFELGIRIKSKKRLIK